MPPATVAVVEDNPDFAAILETVLNLWGYRVERYDTLRTARATLLRRPPAMLILDGQLPDGDGYHFYQELRRNAATRNLPILLLSVSDDVYQIARAASDRDPQLVVALKPIPLEDIQRIVTAAVHP